MSLINKSHLVSIIRKCIIWVWGFVLLCTKWIYNWNWKKIFEVSVALATPLTLIYTVLNDNKKDKEQELEKLEIRKESNIKRHNDSIQIAILTKTYLDSKGELTRIRYKDSMELALQIERNSFDRQEFYRVRKSDSIQLAVLNSEVKTQKLTARAGLRASFPSVIPYFLAKKRESHESIDFNYRCITKNFGKSELRNLRTKGLIIIRHPQNSELYKAFPLNAKVPALGSLSDIINPNEVLFFNWGFEKNTNLFIDRYLDILTIQHNKKSYLLPKDNIYILFEFIYDDIFEDEHKYYRIVSYNLSFRYGSDSEGKPVYILELTSPRKNLKDDITRLKKIITESGIDYKSLEMNILKEKISYDSDLEGV